MARTFVGAGALSAVGFATLDALVMPARADAAELAALDSSVATTRDAQPVANCTSCHRLQQSFSHPVDVVPSMRVPATLPLDAGRMTCATCHDPSLAIGHANKAPRGESFLRGEDSFTNLCSECHSNGRGRAAVHGTGLKWAHLETATKGIASIVGTDAESQNCMACHDGVTAGDAGAHLASGSKLGRVIGGVGDHPIGVPYASRPVPGRDDVRLKSAVSLDRRIRLFARTVGCGSCHNPYSQQENLLVMSNIRSQLCLSCHDM